MSHTSWGHVLHLSAPFTLCDLQHLLLVVLTCQQVCVASGQPVVMQPLEYAAQVRPITHMALE
jgi:hypothetical protein